MEKLLGRLKALKRGHSHHNHGLPDVRTKTSIPAPPSDEHTPQVNPPSNSNHTIDTTIHEDQRLVVLEIEIKCKKGEAYTLHAKNNLFRLFRISRTRKYGKFYFSL